MASMMSFRRSFAHLRGNEAGFDLLQRRLRIGYGRAAAILDIMEREGLIGQADGSRPRPVLGRAYEMIAQWDEAGVEVIQQIVGDTSKAQRRRGAKSTQSK